MSAPTPPIASRTRGRTLPDPAPPCHDINDILALLSEKATASRVARENSSNLPQQDPPGGLVSVSSTPCVLPEHSTCQPCATNSPPCESSGHSSLHTPLSPVSSAHSTVPSSPDDHEHTPLDSPRATDVPVHDVSSPCSSPLSEEHLPITTDLQEVPDVSTISSFPCIFCEKPFKSRFLRDEHESSIHSLPDSQQDLPKASPSMPTLEDLLQARSPAHSFKRPLSPDVVPGWNPKSLPPSPMPTCAGRQSSSMPSSPNRRPGAPSHRRTAFGPPPVPFSGRPPPRARLELFLEKNPIVPSSSQLDLFAVPPGTSQPLTVPPPTSPPSAGGLSFADVLGNRGSPDNPLSVVVDNILEVHDSYDDFTPGPTLPVHPRDPTRPVASAPRNKGPLPLGRKLNDPPQIPTSPSRIEDTLHLPFPILPTMHCTEPDCRNPPFHAASWTASKQSLIRHLFTAHAITIRSSEKWCLLCLKRTGSKVSEHSCFKTNPHVRQLACALRFKCSMCPFTVNTRRGLRNHEEAHRRNRATPNIQLPQIDRGRNRASRELLTNAQKRARSDPTWMEAHNPPPTNMAATSNRFSPLEDLPEEDADPPSHVPVPPVLGPHVTKPPHWNPPALPPATQEVTTQSTPPDSIDPEDLQDEVIEDDDRNNLDNAGPLTPPPSHEDDDTDPLGDFSDILSEILSRIQEDQAWGVFEEVMSEITTAIGILVKLPDAASRNSSFTPQQTDVGSCRVIQRLYRRNRRRAIRLIVEGDSARCHLPADRLHDHFTHSFSERNFDPSIFEDSFPSSIPEIDTTSFSPSEIRSRLHRFENSAPGPDRISYAHLKVVDPECRILAMIFNICLRSRRIPHSWKHSKTILIHKKGDLEDIPNWRPISLCNTLYKLYTGCLASRLTNWLVNFEVLSFTQKGFLPFDGVFEHRFVVTQAQTLAKMQKTDLCMAQVDLTNAFGSIPHAAIFSALDAAGAGHTFTEIIQDIYTDSDTEIIAGDGLTDPIPICAGVRQGCPISGILFNLVLDPVLRKLQGTRTDHHVLAFADDLSLLEASPTELQTQLDKLSILLKCLSLTINAQKCSSFHLSGSTPVGMRPTSFSVDGNHIPPLADGEESIFLGTPVGFHLAVPLKSTRDFMLLGEKIATSKLAPWQRIDALKTFFFPAFVFKMRTEQVSKSDMRIVDDFIRPLIKRTLYIDDAAANEYLYGSSNFGLLAIPKLSEEVDVMMVDNAFKLLTSKDQAIQELAWGDLLLHAKARTGLFPSPSLIENYLNGSQNEEGFQHTTSPYASTWSHARAASTRLGISWRCREIFEVELHINDVVLSPHHRTKICHTIKEQMRVAWANNLIKKPSQGIAIEVTSKHRASNHFLRTGDYTKFADWRFIHKARLNLLRLNANTPWDTSNQQCRRCSYPKETTLHVLSLCKPNMTRRTIRHNAIVDRVIHAKRHDWDVIALNQSIGDEGLRPDIILKKGDEALILDITIPYENRPQAFETARNEKKRKYSNIATLLSRDFKKVTTDAIIVGALGAWDPKNDHILKRFINKKFLPRFRKLCVSETITHTRQIFQKHVLGHIPSETGIRNRVASLINVPITDLPDYDPSQTPPVADTVHSLSPCHDSNTAHPTDVSPPISDTGNHVPPENASYDPFLLWKESVNNT